jgi:hypothetical protein
MLGNHFLLSVDLQPSAIKAQQSVLVDLKNQHTSPKVFILLSFLSYIVSTYVLYIIVLLYYIPVYYMHIISFHLRMLIQL